MKKGTRYKQDFNLLSTYYSQFLFKSRTLLKMFIIFVSHFPPFYLRNGCETLSCQKLVIPPLPPFWGRKKRRGLLKEGTNLLWLWNHFLYKINRWTQTCHSESPCNQEKDMTCFPSSGILLLLHHAYKKILGSYCSSNWPLTHGVPWGLVLFPMLL